MARMRRARTRGRSQQGQSIVEFGIVALLFTLLAFAVVDFGLLLNTWVRLSSATREVARGAAVGDTKTDLTTMLNQLVLPGVSTKVSGTPFTNYCCGAGGENDKLQLQVTYYKRCIPGVGSCVAATPAEIGSQYWGSDGSCTSNCHPLPGDTVVVTLSAPGMEVLTPLVRPFFGCDGSQPHCYVKLGSTAMMRVEGQ